LLENTRLLWPGKEESNSPEVAARLARMGGAYVDDAFAASHRKHASLVGVADRLRFKAAGMQMEKEVNALDKALLRPKKGRVVVIGGSKIGTKLPVIMYAARMAEYVLVGGLLPAEIEKEGIILPDNVIVAKLDKLRGNKDITSESAEEFAKIISEGSTIIWNGDMGIAEKPETAIGTLTIVQGMAQARKNNKGVYILAGGGETETFIAENSLENIFDYISVGGGAMLEYMSGKEMPAIEALRRKYYLPILLYNKTRAYFIGGFGEWMKN
jgi:phosphoglycerate kinase